VAHLATCRTCLLAIIIKIGNPVAVPSDLTCCTDADGINPLLSLASRQMYFASCYSTWEPLETQVNSGNEHTVSA